MLLLVLTYAALTVFCLAVAIRAIAIIRRPRPLRWELYPVPHHRSAAYGGSHYETVNWWEKPSGPNHLTTVLAMLREILFLYGVFKNNRPLWFRSYCFHLGLYLTSASVVFRAGHLLFQFLIFDTAGGTPFPVPLMAVSVTGTIMIFFGAAALLWRRLNDPDVRGFTTWGDVLHLILFIAAGGLSIAVIWRFDPNGALLSRYLTGVLVFAPSLLNTVTWPVRLAVFVWLFVFAYIPLTHMSHFFTKWFLYHDVLWDDAPHRPKEARRESPRTQSRGEMDWSGEHIKQKDTQRQEISGDKTK